MTSWVLQNEALLRLAVFGSALLLFAVWETLRPRRKRRETRRRRWPINLGVLVIGTLVLRFAMPLSALAAAASARSLGVGLLNLRELPDLVSILIALLVLDLVIYFQHLVFHKVPILWRLHRMHHSDHDFDLTTALRFHPLEIVLSMAIKVSAVYALGAPPLAVLLFEIILNGAAIFNHSNLRLGGRVDSWLRCLIVTPDMHRVHHSTLREETDSNYGFNLPWWDRIFGTYRAQPAAGQEGVEIGLPEYPDPLSLWKLLLLPFR